MTYLFSTIKGLFTRRVVNSGKDPVYDFFFNTSSGDRKKIYSKALDKAQAEQEEISRLAKEKVRG